MKITQDRGEGEAVASKAGESRKGSEAMEWREDSKRVKQNPVCLPET